MEKEVEAYCAPLDFSFSDSTTKRPLPAISFNTANKSHGNLRHIQPTRQIMLSLLLSMSLFALVGAITPGPVNIIASSASARYGFLGALPHVLGATISYTGIVLLAGLGVSEALLRLPQLSKGLALMGALYIAWLAYKIALCSQEIEQTGSGHYKPSFTTGALCQLLNPKAWVIAISGVGLYVSNQANPDVLLPLFVTVSFTMCLCGVGVWAAAGQWLTQVLTTSRRQRQFNFTMAALLILSVLKSLLP